MLHDTEAGRSADLRLVDLLALLERGRLAAADGRVGVRVRGKRALHVGSWRGRLSHLSGRWCQAASTARIGVLLTIERKGGGGRGSGGRVRRCVLVAFLCLRCDLVGHRVVELLGLVGECEVEARVALLLA